MRSSVINNERGSVINGKRDNTNCYNDDENDDGDKGEKVGGGDSAPLTPTLSILLTLNTLLTISSQRTPKSINIIDNLTTVFV